MAPPTVSLTLGIRLQAGPVLPRGFETHQLLDASTNLSVLEALDLLNEQLIRQGQPERAQRVRTMTNQMDAKCFGSCSNHLWNVGPSAPSKSLPNGSAG